MLQRIGTEILTPRGRIVDICNIDMFDNIIIITSNVSKHKIVIYKYLQLSNSEFLNKLVKN